MMGACHSRLLVNQSMDAIATNGPGRLSGVDASSHAAFAMALSRPECECDEHH